ncbi:hypothetical protein [Amycolatopsis sp. cmx-8-4]|uniref:hypothetical protein n=1 Tax=Amycolatopsis sp. cmx-8-4 TaxID=2790947 RepID=UPI003978BA6B
MTDAQQPPLAPDQPGAPPIRLLGLVTDAYTGAPLRLAYAERDRHGWGSYRQLGYDLIGVGARVIVHAYARCEPPGGDPRQAAEAARALRSTLRLAEQLENNPAGADALAMEIESLAEDCTQTAGLLYRISARLSPAAIAEIHPVDETDA